MEFKSFKNVLDSLDYTIVDYNRQLLGIGKLESIRENLLKKLDREYKRIEMFMLPYLLWHINCIIGNNFKFNNDEIKTEYNKLGKQPFNWFIQCNTQDKNGNDDVDIIENHVFYLINGCKSKRILRKKQDT